MAKNKFIGVSLLPVLLLGLSSYTKPGIEAVYTSQIGVREATGHNDGPAVEAYLRSVGLGKGYSWCAAFVKWCTDSAGIATPINGWAASAINTRHYIYKNNKWVEPARPGDVFTIWSSSYHRVQHTGFIHRTLNANVVQTVEGNTNGGGSADGDGVYKRTRPVYALHTISRWQ